MGVFSQLKAQGINRGRGLRSQVIAKPPQGAPQARTKEGVEKDSVRIAR